MGIRNTAVVSGEFFFLDKELSMADLGLTVQLFLPLVTLSLAADFNTKLNFVIFDEEPLN